MRTLIKSIARGAGRLLSYVCPPQLPVLFQAALSYAYTGYLCRRFASFGRGSVVAWKACSLEGLHCVHVGERTEIDRHVRLTAWTNHNGHSFSPRITIGNDCHIGDGAHITAVCGITIGDNLLTGTNVLISDNAHGVSDRSLADMHPELRPLHAKGEVVIGRNVWLGNNVCILSGVTIGDGVIVAANSVVTKSVESHTVVAGAPAKIVKHIN